LDIRAECNIGYLIGYPISEKAISLSRISDIFRISNRIPRKCLLKKKKSIGKQIIILQHCIRYYSITNMHTYVENICIKKNQQFYDIKFQSDLLPTIPPQIIVMSIWISGRIVKNAGYPVHSIHYL